MPNSFSLAGSGASGSKFGAYLSSPVAVLMMLPRSLRVSNRRSDTLSNDPSERITGAELANGPYCPGIPLAAVFSRTSCAFASALSAVRASRRRTSSDSGSTEAGGVAFSSSGGASAVAALVIFCSSAQAPKGVRRAQIVCSNICIL
eukprot:CAMPEP_0174705460 /NCGR_PEP_ID=MMETSP1094-20130205/8678_1 /TAXON_ID=156173 /ORGANISM="Chrysochromulina brevifilum, Strain UTEX LB 985" /LENGTH=146 /DNA_ID=CAMNT_0015903627 /DNA_START=147 /DNA_END=587 /DNA_ORIENTATION=+